MLGAVGGGEIFISVPLRSIFHSGGGNGGVVPRSPMGDPGTGLALDFAEFAFHGAGVAFGGAGGAGGGGRVLAVHRFAQAL